MPEGNGDCDRRERRAAYHARLDRQIEAIHASILEQSQRVDGMVAVIRDLIDRIPPENLR